MSVATESFASALARLMALRAAARRLQASSVTREEADRRDAMLRHLDRRLGELRQARDACRRLP